MRTWTKRIVVGILVLGGGFAALNASLLRAKYAGHQLRSATTDDARADHARSLLALGDAGIAELVEALRTDDPPTCRAVVAALRDNFAAHAAAVLDAVPTLKDDGLEAVLDLVPEALKANDAAVADKCRAAVERGLQSSPVAKVAAAKLAARPAIRLTAALVPLTTDADAAVRAAAFTALGTAGDDAPITEDDLFRGTNDPDAAVRTVCMAVLETRGRTAEEIDLGRRLTHPQPRVRLQLLVDLASETSRDIGPWLERLSRDAEPAVRAGAVRVASERNLLYADWADKLATADADPTVRQVATFHRRKAAGLVTPAGFAP
jgi:hypothetical protein